MYKTLVSSEFDQLAWFSSYSPTNSGQADKIKFFNV